jgi:hypothetical protein
VAVLIDGPPEVMQLAADADEHFVQVPLVARLGPAPLQGVGEQPAEAQAPLADALVADHDPARGQDQLDVSTGLEVSPLVGFEYSPFQWMSVS